MSVAIGFAGVFLILVVPTSSKLAGFLLMAALLLIGLQLGIQQTSEDIYIHNCADSRLMIATLRHRQLAELGGVSFAAVFSYIFAYHAQPKIAGENEVVI